jgi:hypothetical protein
MKISVFNPYLLTVFWYRFGFNDHRRFRPLRIFEIDGFFIVTVFFFQLDQGTGIEGPDRASFDAVRQFAFQVSIETKITFAHFCTLFGPELRRIIGAGFQAFDITFCTAQTGVTVHQHNAVLSAFCYGTHRTGPGTHRFGAMPAGSDPIADEWFRKLSLFGIENPHPVFRSGRDVVPILAGDTAGTAAGASCLIEVESYLHYVFSISYLFDFY